MTKQFEFESLHFANPETGEYARIIILISIECYTSDPNDAKYCIEFIFSNDTEAVLLIKDFPIEEQIKIHKFAAELAHMYGYDAYQEYQAGKEEWLADCWRDEQRMREED